jgi:hypothetical protein
MAVEFVSVAAAKARYRSSLDASDRRAKAESISHIKATLVAAIQTLKANYAAWGDDDDPGISETAITTAERVIDLVEVRCSKASVGLNGDGQIFLKLENDAGAAVFLTIEIRDDNSILLHALLRRPDAPSEYLDDEPLTASNLPEAVLALLAKI